MNCLLLMENAAQSIETNGFTVEAFQTIAEAVRSIGKIIFPHSEREEECLFPLIENHVEGSTNALRSEHRKLREGYNDLMESVRNVEDGKLHNFSIRDLVQKTKFLVEFLSNHINKENNVLYKTAQRVLTNDEYQQLRTTLVHQQSSIVHFVH